MNRKCTALSFLVTILSIGPAPAADSRPNILVLFPIHWKDQRPAGRTYDRPVITLDVILSGLQPGQLRSIAMISTG
jgi:hypothetical protein